MTLLAGRLAGWLAGWLAALAALAAWLGCLALLPCLFATKRPPARNVPRRSAFLPVEHEETEEQTEARRLLDDVAMEHDLDDDDGSAAGGGPPHRVLLARAAFTLMDGDGDGELTRVEMISAFRRDERVRKLLLPMLPMESVKRKSICA